MPEEFTLDDFRQPKEEFTLEDFSQEPRPKPEKRPVPQLTLGEKLSGPLYSMADIAERIAYGARHPIKMLEKTAETAASQIAGEPRQLLVRPSEALEMQAVPKIPNIPQQEGLVKQVGAGVGNAVIDFVNEFTTPEGIATLGIGGLPKAAQKTLMKGFAAQMAVDAPQQLVGALDQAKQGNWQEAAKNVAAAGGEAFLAKQLAKPTPLPKGGVTDALHGQTAETVRNLRQEPVEGVQPVPIKEGVGETPARIEPVQPQEGEKAPLEDLTKKGPNEETQRQKEALRETVEVTDKAPPPEEARSLTLTPVIRAGGRMFIGANHSEAYTAASEAGRKSGNMDLMEEALKAAEEPHQFLGSDNKIYSRKAGREIFKAQTGKDVGKTEEGLHSTDLEREGLLKVEREQARELKRGEPPPGEVTPTAKAEAEQLPAPTGEEEFAPVQPKPSAMAVGIAPPGTELAQAGISYAGRVIQGIKTLFKSNPARKVIDQTFDAADNKANISGQQAGKGLRLGTNRLEREAALAIVEANGDPSRLAQFEEQVAGKDDRAREAVRYARGNWNRLQPLVKRTENILDSQIAEEQSAGINIENREGYIPHIYDTDLLMGKGMPYVLGGRGGKGISTGFKKLREFDTVFDAIAEGYKPKSLDVAELVEHRVKQGNKLVNRRAWTESLKQTVDPSDNQPIVTEPIRKGKDVVAPMGYSMMEVVPGQKIAVHNGYSSLFDALTGTSRISGSLPGQIALQTVGGIKHGLLVFDTFHASRILQKELFLTGKAGYKKGQSLLEYGDQDLNRAVQEKSITPEIADWVRQNRPKANLLLDSGLNVGRIQESLYSSFVRQIPLLGTFNKWVFEKLTRGAMMQSGLIEFERVKNALPNLSDKEVALKVSRDLNAYFGNLGRQGLFKSKQAQDVANLVALAPQWVESMARTEAYGAAQAVKGVTIDPILHKTIMTGTIGKAVSQGLAAYFIGTQLLNLITKGHATWNNTEEGHKLDAWIPDLTGKENGFWISPFSVVAELTHDMLRYSHKEGSPLKAAARIASNKASPIWRAGQVLLTGKDYTGKTIDDTWNRVKAAAWALAPVPIPAQAPLKAEYPGQLQRQLTASAGFKTEPAESAMQQIKTKADRFLKESGKARPKIEQSADEPSYNNLRNRLRVQDTKGAKEEIDKLLKTRTRKQIIETMQRSIRHPFTGSSDDEFKFRKTLSPDDKELYKKAVEERKAEYKKFLEVWRK